MADTDPVKWILLDPDLTTSLGELPVIKDTSGLYIQLNETGSGSLSIRYDSAFRPLMTYGTFCECYYRGASRGGFFVENIKETWAETSEYSGRAYAVSGRGLLAILEQGTILGDGSTASTRNITSSKANALLTFLVEAQAEGCFPNLTWDFDSTVDSNGDAWTDGEVMSIPVGTKILEFMKDVAKFGIDFTTSISGGNVVLSAWQTSIGEDKSNTIFMRVGSNCQQVGNDITTSDFANVLRYKWKEGYGKVEDSTSITAYGRRESFINLEVAQSAESAATFASARLEQLKNPKRVTSITTYDGIAPSIFLDYEVGDTISLDNMGTITSDRIQSANLDFTDNPYADVTLQLNDVFIERELKSQQDLDWLLNQWNTARDQELAETTFWAKFGESDEISDIKYLNGKLYIAGTGQVGTSTFNGVAVYDLASGAWSDFGTWEEVGQLPKIGILGSDVVVGTGLASSTTVYLQIFDTSKNLLRLKIISGGYDVYQIVDGGDGKAYAATGYLSGTNRGIAYINSYSDGMITVSNNTIDVFSSVAAFNGDIYAGAYGGALTGYGLHKVSGGALVPVTITELSNKSVRALQVVGSYLAISYVDGSTHNVGLWDGSSSSLTVIGVTDGYVYAMASYLTDLYVGGTFNNITGVSGNFNGVAKYNSAGWQGLGVMPDSAGITGTVRAMLFNDFDLYVGGSISFAQANNISVNNMAIYFNNMQHALDYNSKSSSQFDLAGAIHNASASSVTDNDEFVFWEDVSRVIKKITWANIKATLKTYFDTLYLSISQISDTVYGSGWNGDTTNAPSKNAVYDKIETMPRAAANITDNALVRGDGGAKGLQESVALLDDTGFLSAITKLLITSTLQGPLDISDSRATGWQFTFRTLPTTPAANDAVDIAVNGKSSTGVEKQIALLRMIYLDPTNGSEDTAWDFYNRVAGTNTLVMRTGNGGNVEIGAAGSSGKYVLSIANGTAPSSSPANAVQLYAEDVAASSELKVRDEAGNITTLSPHAKDAPSWLYDDTPGLEEVHFSANVYTGKITYTNETRKNKILQNMVDGVSYTGNKTFIHNETFADYNTRTGSNLSVLNWDENQEALRLQRQAEIKAWDDEKKSFDAADTEVDEKGKKGKKKNNPSRNDRPRPTPYVKKKDPYKKTAR